MLITYSMYLIELYQLEELYLIVTLIMRTLRVNLLKVIL